MFPPVLSDYDIYQAKKKQRDPSPKYVSVSFHCLLGTAIYSGYFETSLGREGGRVIVCYILSNINSYVMYYFIPITVYFGLFKTRKGPTPIELLDKILKKISEVTYTTKVARVMSYLIKPALLKHTRRAGLVQCINMTVKKAVIVFMQIQLVDKHYSEKTVLYVKGKWQPRYKTV